jgi:hypothetical protein
MRELSLESRRREVEKSANLGRQEAASAVDEAHWHSDHFKSSSTVIIVPALIDALT